jgi:hypothetical protein
MSGQQRTRDRLILAWISGVASRRCPFAGRPLEQDADAIAELAEAAQGRADLLAEHAGMSLGLAAADEIPQYAAKRLAVASLCAMAGADMDGIAAWIPLGIKRAEDARASRPPH